MSVPLSFSMSIAAVLAMSVTGIQIASAEQMTGLNKTADGLAGQQYGDITG